MSRDLEIIVGIVDEATQPLRDINHSVNSFSDNARAVSTAVAASVAAAGTAVAGVAVQATREAVAFEQGMSEVFTLLPDVTDVAMRDMTDDVLEFSATAGVVPDEVITPLYDALSAGVPPDNVFDFLEVASEASIAGASNLGTAIDGLTSVVNAYGSEILGVGEASDIIFTTIRGGKTTFDELSASLFNVVPQAASLGIGLDTVGAALAAMTAQGVPTSVATTQLRQLFIELADSGSDVGERFQELTGQAFPDFIAGGGTLSQALQTLEQDAIANNTSLRDLFGSVEATNAALLLTGEQGGALFTEQLIAQEAAAGATASAYEIMQGTVSRALETLRANVDVVLIQLGQQFLPILADFSSWVVANLPSIQAGFQAAFDAIGTAISAGRQAWEDLQAGFQSGVAVNTVQAIGVGIAKGLEVARAGIAAFRTAWEFFSDLPAVQASAEFVANIPGQAYDLALDVWSWLTSQPVQTTIKGTAGFIADVAAEGWQLAQTTWTWLTSQPVQTAIQGGAKFVADLATDAFAVAQDVWAWLSDIAGETIAEARAVFEADVPDMGELLAVGGRMVSAVLEGIAQKTPALLASGADWIADLLEGVTNALPDIITSATDVLVSFIEGLSDPSAGDVSGAGAELAREVGVGILSATATVASAGLDLVVALANAIIQNGSRVITAVSKLVVEMVAEIFGLPDWFVEGANNAIDQLISTFSEGAQRIVQIGADIVQWIIDGVATLGESLATQGREAIDSFIDETLAQIQARASAVTSAITGIFNPNSVQEEVAAGALSIAEAQARAYALGIEGGAADAFAARELLMNEAWGTPENAAFIGASIGVATVNGMEQGMLENLQAAINAGVTVADGVVEAVERRLGIQSPSRVFAQIGDYTMAGFINTVRDKAAEAGSAAREAADAAATAFRDTLAAMQLELDLQLVEPEQLKADLQVISDRLREQITAMQQAGEAGSAGYLAVGRQLQAVESQLESVNRVIADNAAAQQAALDRQREQQQRWADWAVQLQDEVADAERMRYESAVRMGQVSLQEQLAHIQTRLNSERLSTTERTRLEEDAWRLQENINGQAADARQRALDEALELARERAEAEEQAAEDARRYQEALYDFQREQGEITLQQHLNNLREQLAQTEAGTLEEIALRREVADTETDIRNQQVAVAENASNLLSDLTQGVRDNFIAAREAEAEAARAQQQELEAISQAQYDYQRHIGDVTLQDHLANLQERLASEQLVGTERIALQTEIYDTQQTLAAEAAAAEQAALDEIAAAQDANFATWEQRLQAERDARQAAAELAMELTRNQYAFEREQGDISNADHLANLQERLAGLQDYSNEWMSVQKEIAATEQAMIDERREANVTMLEDIISSAERMAPVFESIGGMASEAFSVGMDAASGMLAALEASETGTLSAADAFGAIATAAQSSSDIAISAIGGLANAAMQFASGNILGGVVGAVSSVVGAIGGLFSRGRRKAEEYRQAVEASMNALSDATYAQWENRRANQERILDLQYSAGLIATEDYHHQRFEITELALQQDYRQQQQALQEQFMANVDAAADEQFVQSLRYQYRLDSFNLRQAQFLNEVEAERAHIETIAGMESAAGQARIGTYEEYAARVLQLNQEAFDARQRHEFELAREIEAERDAVVAEMDAFTADIGSGLSAVADQITVSQEQINAATSTLTGEFSTALSGLAQGESFASVATNLDTNFQNYIIETIINMSVEAALANSLVAENMAQLSVLIDGAIQSGDWSGVRAGVVDVGSQLQATLGDLAGTLGGALEEVFDSTISVTETGTDQTQAALSVSGDVMSGAAEDAFNSTETAIVDGATATNSTLDKSARALEDAIAASASDIEVELGLAEGAMSASAAATFETLRAEVDAGTLSASDALSLSSEDLRARIQAEEAAIAAEFAASEASMSGAAAESYVSTEGAIAEGAANITAALDANQSELAAAIEGGLTTTNTAWQENGQVLVSTISATLGDANTTLQTEGDALLSTFNNLNTSLFSAAGQLGDSVASLGSAIADANATQEAAEAAAEAAAAAVNAVEEELDINSPSRVLMDIGEMTMTGFGQGIANNAGVPVAAIQSVTNALIDAANVNLSNDIDLGIRARTAISTTIPQSQLELFDQEQASRADWLEKQNTIASRMEAAAAKFDTASNELSAGTVRAAVTNERAAKEFAGASRQFDWSRIRK